MGALDTSGYGINPVSVFSAIMSLGRSRTTVTPADFRYPWQRNPITAAVLAAHPSPVVLQPAVGRQDIGAVFGTEPGIPSFATPGFSPGGGTPVATTPVVTPPPVIPGPGTTPQLPGPTPDTAVTMNTTSNTMSLDLGNLLSQAITTAGQVMTAQAHPTTPVNFSQYPVMTGNLPVYPTTVPQVTAAGTASLGGSTTHPATPGVQYVGIFDSVGNLLGFKATKTRKRRHRKLVYKSDITGLAELKGVLGTGRLMQEFLAVRGFGS